MLQPEDTKGLEENTLSMGEYIKEIIRIVSAVKKDWGWGYAAYSL